jgi:hypothetical protein
MGAAMQSEEYRRQLHFQRVKFFRNRLAAGATVDELRAGFPMTGCAALIDEAAELYSNEIHSGSDNLEKS